VQAYFEESGIPVHLVRDEAEKAVQQVRQWIGDYEWAESPFKALITLSRATRCPWSIPEFL